MVLKNCVGIHPFFYEYKCGYSSYTSCNDNLFYSRAMIIKYTRAQTNLSNLLLAKKKK